MRDAGRDARIVLVGALLIGLIATAAAQEVPQQTTATYGDWTLRCNLRPGPPPQKICQIVQSVRAQNQPNPVTQIAIGRPVKDGGLKAIIQVPINVWLPAGVKATFDEKEPPFVLEFKRCAPTGCLADLDISDETMTKLRALTANGKLQFKDGTQKDITVPISFKGFGQAFDALSKE